MHTLSSDLSEYTEIRIPNKPHEFRKSINLAVHVNQNLDNSENCYKGAATNFYMFLFKIPVRSLAKVLLGVAASTFVHLAKQPGRTLN